MEEREPTIKILYENTKVPVNQVWITFPLSGRERAEQKMLALTSGHEQEESIPYQIVRVESPHSELEAVPSSRRVVSGDQPAGGED